MKHLLSLERLDVGRTLALTVGSPSAHRRSTMLKHIAFMLLFILSSLNVWGEVYFEDTFSNVGNTDNQSISTRTGWGSFSKCYSQGNSGLRVGSKNDAGSVTKAAMTNISGTKDIKVTVYTAKYNTNANTFTVSVTNGTISSATGVGTLSAGKISISPSANAGVTATTSAANWTDDFKTEFTITGASSNTTITFASNKRVILGPIRIEDAGGSQNPTDFTDHSKKTFNQDFYIIFIKINVKKIWILIF